MNKYPLPEDDPLARFMEENKIGRSPVGSMELEFGERKFKVTVLRDREGDGWHDPVIESCLYEWDEEEQDWGLVWQDGWVSFVYHLNEKEKTMNLIDRLRAAGLNLPKTT